MRRTASPSRPYGRYAVGLRPSLDPAAYFDAPKQDQEAPKQTKNRRSRGLDRPRSFRNDLRRENFPHHKEGKALRTETTINDTTDFSIGKRLTNLPALREIGFSANRRLLHVQRLSHDPITAADALDTITGAVTTATGARIPGLRLAERRSHALLQALLTFGCQTNGFTNADLRALTTELRGLPPGAVTTGQTTYDLRRLKFRGLIIRIPHTHRYRVTDHGLHTAHFLTCIHARFLPTGLAHLADHTATPPLQAACRAYNDALENLSRTTLLAA